MIYIALHHHQSYEAYIGDTCTIAKYCGPYLIIFKNRIVIYTYCTIQVLQLSKVHFKQEIDRHNKNYSQGFIL